jgi:hypothetical protein
MKRPLPNWAMNLSAGVVASEKVVAGARGADNFTAAPVVLRW